MARPRSMLNRYADGLLKVLKDHSEQNPGDWYRAPMTWRRGISGAVQELPDPVLCVSLNGTVDPVDLRPLGYQTSRVSLMVAVLIKDVNADVAAGEMVADIWRVLAQNRQLAAVHDPEIGVDDPDEHTIAHGYLSIGPTRIAAKDDPTQGEAVIEQEVTIQYTWAGTEP
jgi:hypothetical protein